MIKEAEFNDRQRLLYETMSDISEECYFAGWYMGNEYRIWSALQSGERIYGMDEMDADQLELCRALSVELDGWIVWVDDSVDRSLPVEEFGPRFVGMAEWLKMLADTTPTASVAEI